jgi:hypothetical protein
VFSAAEEGSVPTLNVRARALLAALPLLFVAILSAAPARAAEGSRHERTFTLVVIPDTQLAVQNKPELFDAQTEWIVSHRRSRNIPFVVHVGDVVEWPSRVSDWERATTAMYRLNGRVPYAVAVGNHDMDAWACTPTPTCDPWAGIERDRSTTMFNTYFPRSIFRRSRSFGGSYPHQATDNSYFTFSAGHVRWLVLTIKYDPTDDELAWANQVVVRHPRHRVIVNTHEYQNGDVRSPVGERVWNRLARKHANIQFVLSGHYTSAGVRIDRGERGNAVYQMQANYQTYSIPRVNDNSYLRLIAFDTSAGTVVVRTFSPYCERTGECPAYLTDPRNQFTLTGVRFFADRRITGTVHPSKLEPNVDFGGPSDGPVKPTVAATSRRPPRTGTAQRYCSRGTPATAHRAAPCRSISYAYARADRRGSQGREIRSRPPDTAIGKALRKRPRTAAASSPHPLSRSSASVPSSSNGPLRTMRRGRADPGARTHPSGELMRRCASRARGEVWPACVRLDRGGQVRVRAEQRVVGAVFPL